MMRLLLLSVIVFSTPSVALTYYVDSTCNAYLNVGRAIPETLHMARRSDERLGADDADIQAAFQRIFNTDTGDVESVNRVRGIMYGVSQLEASTDFNSADVRIYCDDDARWILKADQKEKDGSLSANPNSGRTPNEQIWYDKVNDMLCKGLPSCKDGYSGVVYDTTIPGPQYLSQNPDRTTMTLCKPYIQKKFASIEEMGNVWSWKLTRVGMAKHDTIGHLLSFVVLHEFTHVFGTDDGMSSSFSSSER